MDDLPDILTQDDHARGCEGREYNCTCGYDDRLENEIRTLRAKLEDAKRAMKLQAGAVRTLQANEQTEINCLRRKQTEAYHAIATLDSEREMNAALTEENEALRAKLAEAEGERQSALEQGVRMGFEAVSEACEARREGYLGKAAQRDPFADDTMNPYDGSVLCAEAMEYARLDVEALDPMEIIHKATRRRKALEELAEVDAALLDVPD